MVTKDKAQCKVKFVKQRISNSLTVKQVKFVPIIRSSKFVILFKMKTNTKSYKELLRDIETKQNATNLFLSTFLKHCEATKN